jgi:hypothetical protein
MTTITQYPVLGQDGTTQIIVESDQNFNLIVVREDSPTLTIPSKHDGRVNYVGIELTGTELEVLA